MDINQIALLPLPPRAPAVDVPTVESLTRLIETDPYSLPADQQVALLAAWERHAGWLEALKADALAAVAGPGPEFSTHPVSDEEPHSPDAPFCSDDPRELYRVEDSVCDEVAAVMRVATRTARRRIEIARDLVFKLPDTRRLLRDGQCSFAHAAAVSDECAHLGLLDARKVELRALHRVEQQTPAQTRRSVRRAVAAICPPDPIAEVEAEFARREVVMYHDGPVMATISATLPAPDAMLIWNALTGCAARDDRKDDTRTMAHKRADALTAWANTVMDDPSFPTMQGKKRLDTQLVITLDTLMGMDDEAGELVGYGPIPAVLARRLAVESDTWRRLVTDPVTGHLLDYGTTTYTPPAALRDYIIARDRTCQFPGCTTAGWRCDIDHIEPWTGHDTGGHTTATNLITLCRRHHRLKTHNRWRITIVEPPDKSNSNSNSDGDEPAETIIKWTSPRGQTHQHPRTQIAEPAAYTPLEHGLLKLVA